jgi:hypothetical protein
MECHVLKEFVTFHNQESYQESNLGYRETSVCYHCTIGPLLLVTAN